MPELMMLHEDEDDSSEGLDDDYEKSLDDGPSFVWAAQGPNKVMSTLLERLPYAICTNYLRIYTRVIRKVQEGLVVASQPDEQALSTSTSDQVQAQTQESGGPHKP
ncbi:unnamed protein product, partial [Chrysoparadoxa australica]